MRIQPKVHQRLPHVIFRPPPSLTVFQKSSSTSTPPINESSQKKTTKQPRKIVYPRLFDVLKLDEARQREKIRLGEERAWNEMITQEKSELNLIDKKKESEEERAWNEMIMKSEIKRNFIINKSESQTVLTDKETQRKEYIYNIGKDTLFRTLEILKLEPSNFDPK